jgi:hypothetical protein
MEDWGSGRAEVYHGGLGASACVVRRFGPGEAVGRAGEQRAVRAAEDADVLRAADDAIAEEGSARPPPLTFLPRPQTAGESTFDLSK